MFRSVHVAVFAGLACLGLLAAPSASAASSVTVNVSCYSNPEKTTIKNTGTTAFTVTSVGSTYKPYSYEPFRVSKKVSPGSSVTYQTGSAASGIYALTHTYIYNDNGLDGAKVVTTIGTFKKACR